MPGIDELSRVIGSLESSIQTLFRKHDNLCGEIKTLNNLMQKRKLWDSVKIVTGAFLGGASVVIAKLALWGGK